MLFERVKVQESEKENGSLGQKGGRRKLCWFLGPTKMGREDGNVTKKVPSNKQ